MAESPVLTVARLLGGIALLNGNLGHQVLGQLLITNSNEVAIAGAAAAVAATSGQQNAAAQIAIRTAVPALAVRALLFKQEQRIERRETLVAEREQELDELRRANKKSAETIKTQKTQIEVAISATKDQKAQIEQGIIREDGLRTSVTALEADREAAASTITALKVDKAAATSTIKKSDETIKDQKTQIEQAITREAGLRTSVRALEGDRENATSTIAALEAEKEAAASTITALGNRNQKLVAEIDTFRTDVVRQSGLNIDDPYRPPKSTTRRKRTTTARKTTTPRKASAPRKTSPPPRTRKPRKPKA